MADSNSEQPVSNLPPPTHYSLSVPTMEDFGQLAELQDLAFEEKRGWCQPISDCRRAYQQAYEFYAKSFPRKLQHCRIIKQQQPPEPTAGDSNADDNGSSENKSRIVGAIQLQLPGDPGDMSFCADGMRNSPNEGNGQEQQLQQYAYIEWIACHPNYTRQGIGTALLEWAIEYCCQHAIDTLALQVGGSNDGAIRLYERHDFNVTTQPGDDVVDVYLLGPIYAYCCLGTKHRSLVYMERRLADDRTTTQSSDVEQSDTDSIGSFRILEDSGCDDDSSEGHFVNDTIDIELPSTRRKAPPIEEIPNNGMERE